MIGLKIEIKKFLVKKGRRRLKSECFILFEFLKLLSEKYNSINISLFLSLLSYIILALLPSCLWHCVLGILPAAWLLLSLPFFFSDLSRKRRNSLKVIIKYSTSYKKN